MSGSANVSTVGSLPPGTPPPGGEIRNMLARGVGWGGGGGVQAKHIQWTALFWCFFLPCGFPSHEQQAYEHMGMHKHAGSNGGKSYSSQDNG